VAHSCHGNVTRTEVIGPPHPSVRLAHQGRRSLARSVGPRGDVQVRGVHTDDDAQPVEPEVVCAVVGVAINSSCAQGRALAVLDPERRMDAPRGASRRRWPERTPRRQRPPRRSKRPRWRSSNRRVGRRFGLRDHSNSELGHMDGVVDAAADHGCLHQRAPLLRSLDCPGSGLGKSRNDPDSRNSGHHCERCHPRRTCSSAGITGGVSRDTLRLALRAPSTLAR
jgi:hypothetical protein